MNRFQEVLIELRKAQGLTQADLANRLGLSRSTIGNYEKGIREPDFETLEKIADFFNVEMGELLGKKQSDKEVYEAYNRHQIYYTPEVSDIAQAIFDNPDLHALMKASMTLDAEELRSVEHLIKTMKETNPDG